MPPPSLRKRMQMSERQGGYWPTWASRCAMRCRLQRRAGRRLWGVLQDRLVSELTLAGASTRGHANKVLDEYRLAHNKRCRSAATASWHCGKPYDHTKLLDLCALHYVRKVYENHTVRLNGQRHRHRQTARCGAHDLRGKRGPRQTPALTRLPCLLRRRVHRVGQRFTAEAFNKRNKNNDTDEQLG